jgi:uncharacterized repeat protein (TIGR01451 family)
MGVDKYMNWNSIKQIEAVAISTILLFALIITIPTKQVQAEVYTGEDLALAILKNQSTYISSTYSDSDSSGNAQSIILSSLGTMSPTHGSTFALFSTGVAGAYPVTTNELNPGDERGNWFAGGQYGYPRDEVEFEMTLRVPDYMHYVYYDVQFFSTEYPEYVGSQYNDKLTITVDSPSMGSSEFIFDIGSGYFVLDSDGLVGTGFDVYATSGYPNGVDWISTTYQDTGADAGASDLVPIGGMLHPISPNENITVTIHMIDVGDNQFDSSTFIDNLMFSGYAKTNIIARKTAQDLNGGAVEINDTIRYTITISNTGSAVQHDNPGDEFEDLIPNNATYVSDSATATSGNIGYSSLYDKITWNGEIGSESSVSITFDIQVNSSLVNGSLIRNQGTVHWDTNEDFTNDADELTDDPYIDDGIDSDGDNETDDDDPTDLFVISFVPPDSVTEGFSDDIAGENATQTYLDRQWFVTSMEDGESNFEVAAGYYNITPQSFKIKLRLEGSPQYWYYNFSKIESIIQNWSISLKCGNATEESNLYLNFTNSADNVFARLKFEYVQAGNPPVDYLLKLYYWSPTSSNWIQISSDTNGYLYNNWYTIRFEKIDQSHIRFLLYKENAGLLDIKEDETLIDFTTPELGSTFSNLAYVEFKSYNNPIVCPMYFWDDHIIELIPRT